LLSVDDDASEETKRIAVTVNHLLVKQYQPCHACGCGETHLVGPNPKSVGRWLLAFDHEPWCSAPFGELNPRYPA
jgi:hypothetical protein